MSLSIAIKIAVALIVALFTLSSWIGLAGPLLGFVIGVIALMSAVWIWREVGDTGTTFITILGAVGVPGVLSVILSLGDPSWARVRLMDEKAREYGALHSEPRMFSIATSCTLATNNGLIAVAWNGLVSIYIKDPIAAFHASSALPDVNVVEQNCLESFSKLRKEDPELFGGFQEFWPEMPQIPAY